MADTAGFHAVQTSPCLGSLNLTGILLLSRDRFADRWTNFYSTSDPITQICGVFVKFFFFFFRWVSVNSPTPTPTYPHQYPQKLHSTNKTSVESPWVILMLFTTRFQLRVNSPDQWLWWHRHGVFFGTGRRSYSESPRTPPLEGTSLHRRNTSVERPWEILSLFTTCFRLRVNWPLPEALTQTCMWQLCGAGCFS